MADMWTLTRLALSRASFANSTTALATTSIKAPTTSDISLSSSLPTATLSSMLPLPASSASGIYSPDSFSMYSPISVVVLSSPSIVPSLALDSVPEPLLTSVPIWPSSRLSSGVPPIPVLKPSATLLANKPSPSPSRTTASSNSTQPMLANTSSQTSPTLTSFPPPPPPPSANPTSTFTSPSGGKSSGTLPVLMIIAIVISVVIVFLLLSIFVRQLALRRRSSRADEGPGHVSNLADMAGTPCSSGYSVATTYHSAHRGEVRIVIERPPGWAERHWPVPPGHPGHPYYMRADKSAGKAEGADPDVWSVAGQNGSNSAPGTDTGAGRGVGGSAHDYAGVRKAY